MVLPTIRRFEAQQCGKSKQPEYDKDCETRVGVNGSEMLMIMKPPVTDASTVPSRMTSDKTV